jgi:selenocysteine-specific elongation factor
VRTLVLGTAGHIDHGKSALVEALTGTHPDRLKEERARGITIELGFAHAQLGDLTVSLVDVPGHERFVRTMLAGAGGLDAVLLVIAANESVMPQTREHFDICRILGIDRGLIVLTKRDLVDADVLALAELEARDLVAGTPLADAPVVAVSAHTGEGLAELRQAITTLAHNRPARPSEGLARVPIDRAFSVKGFGTVVTGTLVTGTIAAEDTLTLLPGVRDVRVRGVQVHGETVATAVAPCRVALNLGGVDLADVSRGMTLAWPDSLGQTRVIDVRLDLLPGSPALRHGLRVRLHHGTGDVVARVLLPEGQTYARLRLAQPMVMTRGDRFVLRLPSPARTIGGGVVLDPEPPRGGVRAPGMLARFVHLDGASPADVATRWIDEAGVAGLTAADLVRRGGIVPKAIETVLDELVRTARIMRLGVHVVGTEKVTRAAADLAALVGAFHRASPADAGVPREEARMRVAKAAAPATFDAIITRAGVATVANSERLALPTHRSVVSDDEARVREGIVRVLQDAGLQPPEVNALAAGLGAVPAIVLRALQALGRDHRVMKLGDLWFHPAVLADLKARVQGMGAGTTVDVATAKAQFGVSRKFAIPLLEYLDRERITRRVGDKRLVL